MRYAKPEPLAAPKNSRSMEAKMYSFDSRVRYSEIGDDGRLSLSAIANYLQDCGTFQSEALGIGLRYLYDEHKAWLLNSWQIESKKDIHFGEMITISTWSYDFKTLYGFRNFTIDNEAGERCVEANSIWILVDTDTMRPIKVTKEDAGLYGKEPKLDMDYHDRKIKLPSTLPVLRPEFRVPKQFIDTNGHVNNSRYILMAEEFLPEGFHTDKVFVEYKKAAVFGDTIVPKVYFEENILYVTLNNIDGQTFAIVEFTGRKEV